MAMYGTYGGYPGSGQNRPMYGGGGIGGPPPGGNGPPPGPDGQPMANPGGGWRPDMSEWGDTSKWKGNDGATKTTQYDAWLRGDQQQFDQSRWRDEFGESNDRWRNEFDRAGQNDKFSQGLARDQFGLASRQVDIGASQFDRQFGQEQKQWNDSFGLQRDQFGEGKRQFDTQFGEGQRQYNQNFGEGQRQFNTNTEQRGLDRESQLTQSRYAAFGRAQAPNARMARSW